MTPDDSSVFKEHLTSQLVVRTRFECLRSCRQSCDESFPDLVRAFVGQILTEIHEEGVVDRVSLVSVYFVRAFCLSQVGRNHLAVSAPD